MLADRFTKPQSKETISGNSEVKYKEYRKTCRTVCTYDGLGDLAYEAMQISSQTVQAHRGVLVQK
jgi:hypothetical protein